jgi:peptidoglycan-associated lipoprotein
MMTRTRSLALLVPVLAMFAFAGCGKKTVAESAPPPAPAPAPETTAPAPPPPTTTTEEPTRSVQDQLADVFFDYDSANLSDASRTTLDANGKVLTDNASAQITIEGHCDDRGTVEYNLALGDRRAAAARDYLVRYGIDNGRIQTISYGEERPFATGADESSYSQNRRAHFVTR